MGMQRHAPHVPGAASEANADTRKALQQAYAQGIAHGMQRTRYQDRVKLFGYAVALAFVAFVATYGAARVLEYVDTFNDVPIVCRP